MAKRRNLKKEKAERNRLYARQFRKKPTGYKSGYKNYSENKTDNKTDKKEEETKE